jgi:predicted TIM-barrel fold metal-dependent hydrolase
MMVSQNKMSFAQISDTAPKAQLIDVHHHFVSSTYKADASARGVAVPGSDWTPEMSLAEMNKSGVAMAMLSQPGQLSGDVQAIRKLARETNEFGARVVRDHPGRFGLFASLPLPDVEGSLKEIEYTLDTLGADGISLLTSYADKRPGDPAFAPVFQELNRRKAVVHFHPTSPSCCSGLIPSVADPVIEWPHDTTRAVVSLLVTGTMLNCREIRFIFSQAGGTLPMLAGRISLASRISNANASKSTINQYMPANFAPQGVEFELQRLYYDIAASTSPAAMAALLKLIPTSQILFGSDFPFVPISSTSLGLTELALPASATAAIQHGNAMNLFRRLNL